MRSSIAAADSAAVVDLGCGRGALARMVAERSPSTAVTGVDNDPAVLARAIVGDGLWQATPDPWCLDAFGPLPEGIELFESIAVAAGWSVEGQATSTIEEWDGFENGWIAGVRSVGTPEATAFADERSADDERYRGTLGFGWLQLIR